VTEQVEGSPPTSNSYGEPVTTTSTIGSYWALVEAVSGRLLEVLMQKYPEAKYQITLNHQPNVVFKRDMLVAWNSRSLQIIDVQDVRGSLRPQIVMICRDYQG